MNTLQKFAEFIVAAQIPSDSIIMRIAKNYRVPPSVARERWSIARAESIKQKRKGDMLFCLEIVERLRNEPTREPQSSALPISRRPVQLRELRPKSAIPIERRHSHLHTHEKP